MSSKIEWTDATWNPLTGCTAISEGCKNCYAERMAKRLKLMGKARYANGFDVTLHPDLLDEPLRWRKPRMVFVNSMSDLFHKDVPLEFIKDAFAVMNKASRHTFQILTKRSTRLKELAPQLTWTPNIWMGVTVESSKYLHRVEDLRSVPAAVRFLSIEPMLSSLPGLKLDGIDWVIVGGESGPGARPIHIDWAREVRDTCIRENAPFFFKQWGGTNKKKTGRILDGEMWGQFPQVA